jgi:hypothetical protein
MLPKFQWINLVQDFFSISDIAKLDSCYCNKDERTLFADLLKCLTKCQFIELKVSTDLFGWIHSKIANARFVCAYSAGLQVVEPEVEMSPEAINMMMKGCSYVSCQNKEFVSAVLKQGGGEVVSINFESDNDIDFVWFKMFGNVSKQHLPNLT